MKDLRRQRREFAALTEHMSEGLLVIDKETRVLSYNAAALRLLHADAPAETGESVLALNREAGFRRCVETVLAGRRCEELIERDDACCRLFANPVEQNGTLTGAVLIIMDVTEQERREALRREFVANVSHELRTPLTNVRSYAETIREAGDDLSRETENDFLDVVISETDRMTHIVQDLLTLSRLDSGRSEMNMVRFPFSAAIRRYLSPTLGFWRRRRSLFLGTRSPSRARVCACASRASRALRPEKPRPMPRPCGLSPTCSGSLV